MAKWLIGFVVVEFLFLVAWVAGIDRNQRRRRQAAGGRGQDDEGGAWRPAAGQDTGQGDGGQYRAILAAELVATLEILRIGIERLETDPDVSLAGLRKFRDGLAAQVYAMRNCKMQDVQMGRSNWEPMPPILQNGAGHWVDDGGGVWMLDKGEAPR